MSGGSHDLLPIPPALRACEAGVALNRAGMTVFRDTTFLAAGPASERSCYAARHTMFLRMTVLVAFAFVWGCNNADDRAK